MARTRRKDWPRLPWFPLYPGDWKRQTAILTYEEKGIWADLRCILHDMEDRGKLSIKGKKITDEDVAEMLGISTKVYSKLSAKLSATGAAKIEANTEILCDPILVEEERKRLERQRLSDMRSEIGRIGGNVSASKQQAKVPAKCQPLSLSLSQSKLKQLREQLLSEPDPIQSVKKAAYEVVKGRANARHVFASGKDGLIDTTIEEYLGKLDVATLVDDLLGMVGKDVEFPIKYCTTRQQDEDAPRWEMMARERKWQETKNDDSIAGPIERFLGGPGDSKPDVR